MMNALLANELEMGLANVFTATPHVKTSRLRALAASSLKIRRPHRAGRREICKLVKTSGAGPISYARSALFPARAAQNILQQRGHYSARE
jgi:hypothetical protein